MLIKHISFVHKEEGEREREREEKNGKLLSSASLPY